MRKEVSISKTCQLEIETEPESTILGWKYAIGDGGSGGASTFATLETDAEFNRLALEAPLAKRMVEVIKNAYVFRNTLRTGEYYQFVHFAIVADDAKE